VGQQKNIFLANKKICVVRTDKIGDMILTLPLVRVIKLNFPEKETILIAQKINKPIIENNPFIDKIYYIDDYKNIDDIFKEAEIKVAFFPRPNFSEIFSAFKSGVSLRIGITSRWYSFLFNFKVKHHRSKGEKNEAEYNVEMLNNLFETNYETILCDINVVPATLQSLEVKLNQKRINLDADFVIFHPGSGGSSLDWSTDNFAELASMLTHEGKTIVCTGDKNDKILCSRIEAEAPNIKNVSGLLNLEETIALISKAKGLIANSTGIIHIAAALGVSVLGLYPNKPQLSANRWGPWTKNRRIVRPPQSNDLQKNDDMSLISVDKVYRELIQLLNGKFN